MNTALHLSWRDLKRGRRVIVPAGELRLPAASPFGVVGINGAGKTTLLMAIAGVLGPGACCINGRATDEMRVGYIAQNFPLAGWLCGSELSQAVGTTGALLDAAMPGFHLAEVVHKRAAELSPGQAQALSAALALAAPADVLVLDEPFTALDIRRRTALRALARTSAAGRPLFLSSQAGSDLLELSRHFILMRAGRVVFNGPLAELLDGAPFNTSALDRFERAVVAQIS